MVTWTESHDRYTLKASEWEWAFLYAMSGIACLLLALGILDDSLPVCVVPGVVLLLVAVRMLPVAWLEVPLQGGEVRWGVGSRVETPTPVKVESFDVDAVIRPLRHGDPNRYTVVAVLPDGSRYRVLGSWDCFPPDRALSLAAQLNGILGREERPPMLDEASSSRVGRERIMGGCLLLSLLIPILWFFFALGRGC